MVTGIIIAAALVGGVGLFIGIFLGVAGKKFAVEVDEREIQVREELPGNNCGGCGFPGKGRGCGAGPAQEYGRHRRLPRHQEPPLCPAPGRCLRYAGGPVG